MKKFIKALFLSSLLILGGSAFSIAQERFLRPVDEGGQDASFNLFREKLIRAVKAHDAKFLLSIVDKNIKNGFGGDDGINNFKKGWKINSPKSELWDELLFVLTHGGAFSKEGRNKLFSAPYIFTNFPADLDGFEHGAITGTDVNLRSEASTASRSIASLSYNVVKMGDQDAAGVWRKVTTLGGKSGYVQSKYVRSAVDFRAGFEQKRGQWVMTFFLAGD